MKILRITVNNIASLAGIHTVDFTRDPLRSAGLFAISGATGAGKSTLLDALCLALFDATPRLRQVGRLADLNDGEKQNDPRMLLRRGAGEGFAEVAFVGVDHKSWTARWSVRRSHGKADGALRQVEMTLFEGHIPPAGTGPIAEGGKKTLVKEAIVEKVGLKFDQFTRAVLLAQNDFATFLTADDKQRAEILQALTGTEHFEAISKAVFERCGDERRSLDSLEARLEGNQPLNEESRTAAEATEQAARDHAEQIQQRVTQRESHAEWFRQKAKREADLEASRSALRAAVVKRDAATDRRTELQHTEIAAAEARKLRDTELQAVRDFESTTKDLASAEDNRVTQQALVKMAAAVLETTLKTQNRGREEYTAAQPLLRRARELDGKLNAARDLVTKTDEAFAKARDAVQAAAKTHDAAVGKRDALQIARQDLRKQRDTLSVFVAFADESVTWLHRLDTAVAAEQHARKSHENLENITATLQRQQQERDRQRETEKQRKQEFEETARLLREAEKAENAFDAEQLANEQQHADDAHRALAKLSPQLRDRRQQRDDERCLSEDINQLQLEQTKDEAALQNVRDKLLPAAECALRAARDQLEWIQAAVDDHASRLRTSLQEEQPCPVCGSLEHPYRDHEPDIAATAVTAAKKGVQQYEKQRDQAGAGRQKLELATQERSKQISKQRRKHDALRAKLGRHEFETSGHPLANDIVALPEDARSTACDERLEKITSQQKQIQEQQKAHRDAVKVTQARRNTANEAREQWESLQQRLTKLEQQLGVTKAKHELATNCCQQADSERTAAMNALGGLWSGLPNSRDQFSDDAVAFRMQFEESTNACSRCDQELRDLDSKIQQVIAPIPLLADAVQKTNAAQVEFESEHTKAVEDRDSAQQQRQAVFEGRAADMVEQGLLASRDAVEKQVAAATTAKHDAEKALATAEATLKSAETANSQSHERLAKSREAVVEWTRAFAERMSRQLTIEELDALLARDHDWINAERMELVEIDEAVTSARGKCDVYEKHLHEHLAIRPTDDKESIVLETLETLRGELKEFQTAHDAARDVIRNDDRLREQNEGLTRELSKQQTIADPWMKLNELIGSADGAKFRMIAQRRTLDILLSYANHQLTQLSARYRLERLPESLNLIVIDCDMGNERRSIHSLSGGESFLVSLALALGLASLTSNRLRIESLFIDEGFGSLDPETLNTAMNALMHLEAQGRKVGVISHVTEMTDAIPVKVQVIKRRGGASQVMVPGAAPVDVTASAVSSNTAATKSSRNAATGSDGIARIANEILEILQREHQHGRDKVSVVSLRKEIDCPPKDLKAAQATLDGRITAVGRSLRLAAADA